MKGLNRYWPSLKANNLNEEFWKYEYEKHGSCISPFHNDQDRYFSEALKVAENSNLENVLSNAGSIHIYIYIYYFLILILRLSS